MLGLSPVDAACSNQRSRQGVSFRVWAQFARTSVLNFRSGFRSRSWKGDPEEVIALRGRFGALEGEHPMKSEEVTDDQLSVVMAGQTDFGQTDFGQR